MNSKAIVKIRIKNSEINEGIAEIEIEKRTDFYYVSWTAKDSNGKNLGAKSFPVSFRVIDHSISIENYLQNYITENIQKTKWQRKKAFEIVTWEWL